MARAIVELICRRCKQPWQHEKKYNSWTTRQAVSYEDWARRHIFFCPTCHAAIREEEERRGRREAHVWFETQYGPLSEIDLPPLAEKRDQFLLDLYRAIHGELKHKNGCSIKEIENACIAAKCTIECIPSPEIWAAYADISPMMFAGTVFKEAPDACVAWYQENYPALADDVGRAMEKAAGKRAALRIS